MSRLSAWKWFLADIEKEEAWLNEMAAKGLDLVIPGKIAPPPYRFVEGAPGEWTYRIAFLPAMAGSAEGRRYLEFTADAGIETVFASGRIAYLRKRSAEGPFEILSDLDSRIAQYRVMRWWPGLLTVLEFVIFAVFFAPLLVAAPNEPGLVPLLIVCMAPGVFGVALGVTILVREGRRIRSLEAQRHVFE